MPGPQGGGEEPDADAPRDGGTDPGTLVLEAVTPTTLKGVAGDVLTADCIVRASRRGVPVGGVPVSFAVLTGGGTTAPMHVTTDGQGQAATRWTLGFGGKGQLLRASAVGTNNVDFTADASPRPLAYAPAQGSPFPVGAGAWALAVGRLDADELPDVAVTLRSPSGRVAILRNVGGGALGAAETFDTGAIPEGLALARLNGDAIDDVVTANRNSDNITVYFDSNNGRLVSRNDYSVGRQPTSVVIADFDGSGTRDLAVSSHTDNQVTVLLGDGTGTFLAGRQVFPVGERPLGLATGDLNGDAGDLTLGEFSQPDYVDLVVAQSDERATGSTDHTLGVLLGGRGLAFDRVSSYRVERGPLDVKLGEIDDMPGLDAVVGNTTSLSLSLLSGNGRGQFGPPVNYPLGTEPGHLAVADVDGDGLQDVIVTAPRLHQVLLLLNTGRGLVLPARTFTVGNTPRGVAVADVNGDRMPDILVANSAAASVTVLLRQ